MSANDEKKTKAVKSGLGERVPLKKKTPAKRKSAKSVVEISAGEASPAAATVTNCAPAPVTQAAVSSPASQCEPEKLFYPPLALFNPWVWWRWWYIRR